MQSERNIVLQVVLTLVTCGLWSLVWFFLLGRDIQRLRGDAEPHVIVDFFLIFLTCGLWSFVVAYQWTEKIQQPLRDRGEMVDPNLPVISLVCLFFGLHLIVFVLLQSLANQALRLPPVGPRRLSGVSGAR